ncbi:superfamily II DNA or RNA helicase [Catenuloplanes nepalensis]|uniref:Superfamily II DNA or RNA helicase n=1 Tax=Catenuloplanes nepalensis TaxID=587533 RepID=A0ABT9MZ43_9ACTN|nr:DEAD/DEAH box helicase family protein [Catenuloplanes nepalensis]MDP9796717.1 superfamily II DNA or RNA helicase [Catenuloplanes nepalensis]
MSGWLPYDAGLVAQIAAAMDLRAPNAAALAAAAHAVAAGDGREVVCELATGVGKSYVSAALVDYLAERGVRHVLIVTPGTAIREKTIGNFTPGHPRFVAGAEHPVAIVTGPAPPQDGLTLYVFTVQQLIRPGATVSRRLRAVDETLGAGLYQRLAETDDLVVIADEHHVYRESARAFGAAVRDLAPRALIGFTATPDRADRDRVVFRYPLASAIADGLVSIPVLVGATDTADPPLSTALPAKQATSADHAAPTDHATRAEHAARADQATPANHAAPTGQATPADQAIPADQATPANHVTPTDHAAPTDHSTCTDQAAPTDRGERANPSADAAGGVPGDRPVPAERVDREEWLRRACRLREAKEVAWHAWAAAHGVPPMTPLIFVVCRVIDDAAQVADELAALLPGARRVLLVTSRSSDDALRALTRVSEIDSPVRAVVSVDKLSSGWDVPNVGVILALRALASETLTEQVLGRGLRLPYGRRVGVPAVDSVDVLTHESYRELLTSTDELREAIAPGSRGTVAHAGGEATLTVGSAPVLRISGYARALADAHAPVGPPPFPAAESAPAEPVPLRAVRFSLAAIPSDAAFAAGHRVRAAAGHGARTPAAHGVHVATGHGVQATAGRGVQATAGPGTQATAGPGTQATTGPGTQATTGPGTQATTGPGYHAVSGDGTARPAATDASAGAPTGGERRPDGRADAVRDLADRLLDLPLVEATGAEVAEAGRLAAAYLAGRAATAGGDGVRWDTAAAERAADALAEIIADAYRRR